MFKKWLHLFTEKNLLSSHKWNEFPCLAAVYIYNNIKVAYEYEF